MYVCIKYVCMYVSHLSSILYSSKLLQQLDKATEEDPVEIEEAVMDKGLQQFKYFTYFILAGLVAGLLLVYPQPHL